MVGNIHKPHREPSNQELIPSILQIQLCCFLLNNEHIGRPTIPNIDEIKNFMLPLLLRDRPFNSSRVWKCSSCETKIRFSSFRSINFPVAFWNIRLCFPKKKKEKKLNGRSLTTFKGGKSFGWGYWIPCTYTCAYLHMHVNVCRWTEVYLLQN